MKSVINSSSFLFILISWSLMLLSHCAVVFSLNTEGVALLSLLTKFSFESIYSIKLDWNNLSSSSSTPCHWLGVGCNTQNDHVVSLSLSFHEIDGQLGPQLGQLTYLKYLDLSYNHFNGSIPIELWNCSHLKYLDLSSNRFSGKLPEAVKNLQQLDFLSISINQLSGRIPVSLFQISSLKSFGLSANYFNGSIPTELWNCSHLQHLDLSFNHFTGEFPHEAMRNLHQLKTFFISENQFSGRIPEYLFQNSGLETVNLRDNNLSGSIPTSIANCTKLMVLDLRNNGLCGELPVEMTTELRQLKRISLSDNHFFGSVPKDLGINSTSLEWVDFSNNTFSGEIPPNLCFGQKLYYMKFDHNQFHGNIPPSYTTGNCPSLTDLNLQVNKLTGSLPHFGQINNPSDTQGMQYLDLSRNNIQGQIPSSICNLISLSRLDLSENQMNGTLPHCLGHLNLLSQLKLRSNNFSGTIPMNFTSHLHALDLNGNCLEGKIPRSLWINSPSLNYLDLGNNQFNDTFPSFSENSSSLEILVLRSNKLYGSLLEQYHPHSHYTSFNALKILDISNNYFSGNLSLGFILGFDAMKNIVKNLGPVVYIPISSVVIHKGKEMRLNNTMMDTFRAIDMSNNRFQGSIPESIGELLFLTSLNLSNNNLNGRIPSSLGNLTRLESLDLSENKLFGEIPGQLTNLNFLGVLNLSHNHLTGHIPTAGQFQTYPNDSFIGNPGLCGLQSSTGCGNDTDKGGLHRDPVVEKESYEDSNSWSFGWEPVVIGYGCGVLIGLVIQYFIFTKASMHRWFG